MATNVNTTNVVNKAFKEAYDNLPIKYKAFIRESIMEECGWGRSNFYSKRYGRVNLSRPEALLVESIFSRYGFDVKIANKITS